MKIRQVIPCPNDNCDPEFGCCICDHSGYIEVFLDEEKEEINFRDELSRKETKKYIEKEKVNL